MYSVIKLHLHACKSIIACSEMPHALPVILVGLFGHRYVEIEKESILGVVSFKRNVLVLISHFAQVAASLAISLLISDSTHP